MTLVSMKSTALLIQLDALKICTVKNGYKVEVIGIANVQLRCIHTDRHTLTGVQTIPTLKNSLVSLEQQKRRSNRNFRE